MELVVISAEREQANEASFAVEMLRRGLDRFHLRRPDWSDERRRAWREALPKALQDRVVLHQREGHEGAVRSCSCHTVGELRAGRGPSGARPAHGAATSNEDDFIGRGRSASPERRDAAAQAKGGGEHNVHSERDGRAEPDARLERDHRIEGDAGAESVRRFDALFFSPLFASPSKPARPAVNAAELEKVRQVLRARGDRRTRVIALSGITPERVAACREMGFDGVAVMGGIWDAAEPMAAFEAYRRACWAEPILCLTQDGLAMSHVEQARRLCDAGAKWIQLRMKGAAEDGLLATAREVTAVCHAAGARCVINDRVDVALAVGADGAHLGAEDGDWREARRALGPGRLLGGTVNDLAGARRAVEAGCLDYVGVGPLRFTTTKARLAPVLGVAGIGRVIAGLEGLPAWAIGGVVVEDLTALRGAGANGVAVTGALYGGGHPGRVFRRLADGWTMSQVGDGAWGQPTASLREDAARPLNL